MKVLVDVRPGAIVPTFYAGYTRFEEQPHPDQALVTDPSVELVSLGWDDGTFLSLGDHGELNSNVTPPGHAPTAGANERFNKRSGGYVHDKSGAAVSMGLPIAGLP